MLKQIKEVDWTPVIESAKQYAEYVEGAVFHEDGMEDYENEIMETVMTALYGQAFWEVINERLV